MHLQIVSLNMRYSFETKNTDNILVAVLPGGRCLEFQVSDAEVNALMYSESSQDTEPQDTQVFEAAVQLPVPATTTVRTFDHRGVTAVPGTDEAAFGEVERNVQPPSVPRSSTIESDSAGNPVVQPRPRPAPVDDLDEDTGARSI